MNEQLIEPESERHLPSEPSTPITSRFLFVDVAALRAKQLRGGARLRFGESDTAQTVHKAERLAMEEVSRGLVPYYHTPTNGNATAGKDAEDDA